MAKKTPALYSILKTFLWFAAVSILLTAGLVALVVSDHAREWKEWQKKFVRLKLEKTRQELRTADEHLDRRKLEKLETDRASADTVFKAHRADYEALQKKLESLDAKIVKATSKLQDLKQYHDSYKYFYEEAGAHRDPRALDYERKLKALEPELNSAKGALESLEKDREDKQGKAEAFVARQKSLQKEIEMSGQEKNRLEKRLEKLKPGFAQEILNAPMLDFMAPTLQIQQVVLEDLYDDYHFAKTQKVDRCITCHLGIDQKGFENAPQPFRTHPKLELYLGSNSPHPVEKFGCTVCHGGNGHSVSFKDAAHTPRDESQKEEWQKKYRWKESEHWEPKMLSADFVQASCAQCHQGVVSVPEADGLNRGRRLAQTYGCIDCHKIAGFSDARLGEHWKVGPSLQHIQSKLNKDWIIRWLHNPRSFRNSTKMPSVFHLSNTSSPEDSQRNDVAIASIAAYLLKNSQPVALTEPPVEGDIQRGERLVKEVGCLGCHSAAGVNVSDFGPPLTGLGSKVSPAWLYSWLKDPKHYSRDTRMPNLRLSEQEAADITRYLLSQRNAEFEAIPLPEAKPDVMDEMILVSLEGTLRREDAKKELARMSPEEKLQTLGKKSIAHQGCFACHTIQGFENAKPIGAELSNEGRKDIHQLDFGFMGVDHTREAWFDQKLKEPRIFDRGKIKDYYEKLRMPQFHFSDEERLALVTFLLSLTDESPPLEMQRRLDLKEQQTEKGRFLVQKLNCNGCHTLEGKGGTLREFTKDPGAAPPILDGEGAKVQEKWLHDFLKAPSAIRPWLTYRMPTFGFTEEELNILVQYFDNLDHQEVSYQGYEIPETTPEKIRAGKTLFEQLQCAKCHEVSPALFAPGSGAEKDEAVLGASFLAPDLALAKDRLKPHWIKEWVRDPQKLQPETMMPTFFVEGQTPLPDILGGDVDQQIEAIRDYLLHEG